MIKSILFAVTLLFAPSAWANGVSHPDFQPTRGEMTLTATATATWLVFFEVYDAALYTGANAQSDTLLSGASPFSLELRYKVPLTKAQLIEGADVALGRQHSAEQIAAFQADVDALHNFYRDVEEGDRFRLDISNDNGLTLLFNDELIHQNANVDFAKYYVGLWLAENPLSDRVREGLLDW